MFKTTTMRKLLKFNILKTIVQNLLNSNETV